MKEELPFGNSSACHRGARGYLCDYRILRLILQLSLSLQTGGHLLADHCYDVGGNSYAHRVVLLGCAPARGVGWIDTTP
jgi:hypothetical protein